MKKALVVDDTKSIRTLLKTCLDLIGYETITVNNGQEALQLFQTETFDLAFLDIKMPEISGTEVLRRIRALGINTPVIIMTAFATVKNAVECTRLGAVAYLQKPFTADTVKNAVTELETCRNNETDDINQFIGTANDLINVSKLDEALTLLKQGLSKNINSAEIYRLIGRVYELKGDAEEASRFFNISKQFD
jgi:two-component system, OmpR family, response regulator